MSTTETSLDASFTSILVSAAGAESSDVPFTSLFIDGENRPASTNKSFEVRNSLTGSIVGRAASASREDCLAAIESAGRAFIQWEHSPLVQRRDILLKAAELLESERYSKRVQEYVKEETAAPDHMMLFNYFASLNYLRDVAGMTGELKGNMYPSSLPGGQVLAQRRAMGVILSISPWNAPVALSIRAAAIPILCGNTVVLKCSEESPRSQALVAELFYEAGLPKGVLNFVSMDRADAPELTRQMIAHPLIRKINFTGSDVVGRIIATEAAKHLKPCVLELGGKAPVIVLDDADLPKAARAIVFSALTHTGQICISTERVLIQRQASHTLIPLLVEHMQSFTAGNPADRNRHMSALFREDAAERVVDMVKEAKEMGAEVLVGDAERVGSVVQPHVVAGCKPGMKIWDKESFGPVLAIAVADTADELIALANASEFSLAAGVWSANLSLALKVANQVRSGVTNINGPTLHAERDNNAGLGGASGYGHFNVDHFTDVRLVVVHTEEPVQYPFVG